MEYLIVHHTNTATWDASSIECEGFTLNRFGFLKRDVTLQLIHNESSLLLSFCLNSMLHKHFTVTFFFDNILRILHYLALLWTINEKKKNYEKTFAMHHLSFFFIFCEFLSLFWWIHNEKYLIVTISMYHTHSLSRTRNFLERIELRQQQQKLRVSRF